MSRTLVAVLNNNSFEVVAEVAAELRGIYANVLSQFSASVAEPVPIGETFRIKKLSAIAFLMHTSIAHVANDDCITNPFIRANGGMRVSFVILGISAHIAYNVFIDVIFLGEDSSLPVLTLLGCLIHTYLISQDVSLFNQ